MHSLYFIWVISIQVDGDRDTDEIFYDISNIMDVAFYGKKPGYFISKSANHKNSKDITFMVELSPMQRCCSILCCLMFLLLPQQGIKYIWFLVLAEFLSNQLLYHWMWYLYFAFLFGLISLIAYPLSCNNYSLSCNNYPLSCNNCIYVSIVL